MNSQTDNIRIGSIVVCNIYGSDAFGVDCSFVGEVRAKGIQIDGRVFYRINIKKIIKDYGHFLSPDGTTSTVFEEEVRLTNEPSQILKEIL